MSRFFYFFYLIKGYYEFFVKCYNRENIWRVNMITKNIFQQLQSLASTVLENEPLSKYTFTKTGGKCDFFVIPNDYYELQNVIKFANNANIPHFIIGNGSNLIIKDGGITGIVISLLNLDNIHHSGNRIIAQSGATIINTSRYALKNKLSGLEFSCGIPGSVGGAVYMNAGAYGGEIKDCLESVLLLSEDGEFTSLTNKELNFSYRKSLISDKNYIILEATFLLEPKEYDLIESKMKELTFLRESKQPLEFPSCGSVFKRPEGYFAGKLIQDSGLRGYRIGGVEISTKHSGFMVNVDNGTATDYINLINHVKKTVKNKFNVDLETEVKIIGKDN